MKSFIKSISSVLCFKPCFQKAILNLQGLKKVLIISLNSALKINVQKVSTVRSKILKLTVQYDAWWLPQG